ncbi:hypothetical protein J7L60_06555 [Candidatus Bathyarchaeota archaeon]|nr:hypothetical protein [Candidatus Bathyarchaeota archaeon]
MRVANIRPMSFQEVWDIYFSLPERGREEDFLESIARAIRRSRKTCRSTLNTLILLGVVRERNGELERVRLESKSELRRLVISSLGLSKEGALPDLLFDRLGVTGSRTALRSFGRLLNKMGLAVPVERICFLKGDPEEGLILHLSSLGGAARVSELRERMLNSGFTDTEFKGALLRAALGGSVTLEGREDLLELWRTISGDRLDPPVAMGLDEIAERAGWTEEEVRRRLSSLMERHAGLLSLDTQRGREILTLFEPWDERDEVRVVEDVRGC